jgi:hypothetical protein
MAELGNGNGVKLAQAADGAFARWAKLVLQFVGIPVMLLGMQRGCDKLDAVQDALGKVRADQALFAQALDQLGRHFVIVDGEIGDLQRSDQQQTVQIQVDENNEKNYELYVDTVICNVRPADCRRQK